jgi:hypothetical protein
MKLINLIALAMAGLAAGSLSAAVYKVYDSDNEPGKHGFNYIREQTGFGTTYGAMIAPDSPMGAIAGFRIWSFDNARRADANWLMPEPLTGGFRVTWYAMNQMYDTRASDLRKVSLRAANPGPDMLDNINTSSTFYQNLVEVIADGTVSGAWNWDNQYPRGTSGVAPSRAVADPVAGAFAPHRYDVVVNASMTEDFSYVLHGIGRTLLPLRIDMFIDGVLVIPAGNSNGTIFENKSGFDPALGFGVFSFTTATASHIETDFFLDKIYTYSGEDVSEGEIEPPVDPLADLLAEAEPVADGWYAHPMLGLFWSDGEIPYVYTPDSWLQLAHFDAAGAIAYHLREEVWVWAPAAAPGHVWIFEAAGWYRWTTAGTERLSPGG